MKRCPGILAGNNILGQSSESARESKETVPDEAERK